MSAPGIRKYRVFKAIFDATDIGIEETLAFNTTVVTDDEEDWINEGDDEQSEEESQSGIPNDGPPESETASSPVDFFPHRPEGDGAAENEGVAITPPDAGYNPTGTHNTSYELFETCHMVENTDTEIMNGTLMPTAEMIQWHYQLGHLPFSRLRVRHKKGSFPSDW